MSAENKINPGKMRVDLNQSIERPFDFVNIEEAAAFSKWFARFAGDYMAQVKIKHSSEVWPAIVFITCTSHQAKRVKDLIAGFSGGWQAKGGGE